MSDVTVAFIGLGNMGLPMTKRLTDCGYRVLGYDANPEAVAKLAAVGAEPAADVASAIAGSDLVILMLPNSAIVESVILADDAVAALREGQRVIDMSSSDPQRTRALAAQLAEHGVTLIDAPVSGGVSGAVKGTLTVMVGGDVSGRPDVVPVLESFGKVVLVGDIGAGHAVKALNNLLSAMHLLATSEVILAGRDFGLDPERMLAVFNSSSGRSGSTENKWPNFILTESYDSGFGLGLMLKDVTIATTLMADLGRPSAIAELVASSWREAASELDPAADHTEIAKWLSAGADAD